MQVEDRAMKGDTYALHAYACHIRKHHAGFSKSELSCSTTATHVYQVHRMTVDAVTHFRCANTRGPSRAIPTWPRDPYPARLKEETLLRIRCSTAYTPGLEALHQIIPVPVSNRAFTEDLLKTPTCVLNHA